MRDQTFKPYKALIALFAALALCFFAACSSESDPDPAYCGTWTPTEELVTYLNAALEQAMTSDSDVNDSEASEEAEETTESGGESEATDGQASDGQTTSSIQLSTSSLSLTISSNNTVSISVLGGAITIPGTYTYSGDDSSGTFNFTLDYTSISYAAEMAQAIGSAFTGDVTYTTGSLSVVLGTDTDATVIFTK